MVCCSVNLDVLIVQLLLRPSDSTRSWISLRGSDRAQAALQGFHRPTCRSHCQARPCFDPEFAKDVFQMFLNRAGADFQQLSDFRIGLASRHPAYDFPLAFRQGQFRWIHRSGTRSRFQDNIATLPVGNVINSQLHVALHLVRRPPVATGCASQAPISGFREFLEKRERQAALLTGSVCIEMLQHLEGWFISGHNTLSGNAEDIPTSRRIQAQYGSKIHIYGALILIRVPSWICPLQAGQSLLHPRHVRQVPLTEEIA